VDLDGAVEDVVGVGEIPVARIVSDALRVSSPGL
jgi:hypothetical protein